MNNYLVFKSPSRFYDDVNFPYGFDRAGIFTRSEVETLHDCGVVLRALETGQQPPMGEEQERFVAVCQGQAVAESSVEKTWIKYRNQISQTKQRVSFYNTPDGNEVPQDSLDDLM